MFLIHLFILVLGIQFIQTERYDGHQVLKVYPHSNEDKENILKIVHEYGLDVWRRDPVDKYLAIHINPEILPPVTKDLQQIGVKYTTWIPNIQSMIDKQHSSKDSEQIPRELDKMNNEQKFFFTKYHTFEEISALIYNLTKKKYYGPLGDQILVDHKVAGRTYHRNPIHMLKIYKQSNGTSTSKKAIFVEGGMHAREWISPAFVIYLINELITNPSRSPGVEDLVDTFDWYIVPVFNPDGYIYTHTHDRLWRKNRRPLGKFNRKGNIKKTCYGVDINRNFGYMWNTDSDPSKPCSILYSGPSAFSEPETRVVRDIVGDSTNHFISYLSFHSYGRYWMYPWGYTSLYPRDTKILEIGAKIATNALRQRYNTSYTVDSIYNALYQASGVSIDYTKAIAGIKYSYSIELPDKEQYGFLLPSWKILPTCLETMDAVNAFVNFLKAQQAKFNARNSYEDLLSTFYRK